LRPSCRAGAGWLLVAYLVVLPVALAVVVSHKARAPVERADLGTSYQRVELTTADGLRLQAWYAPSRNRAAVIVFPAAADRFRLRGCWPARATAC
jgi:hypothetical protein